MSNHKFALLFALMLALVTPSLLAKGAPGDDEGKALLAKADSLYRLGYFEKAVPVYLQAAQLGNAEAQFDMGYACYNGEGTDRDYTSAAMWFKRAARQQFAKAQYNLAYCYMNGRGVPRDYDKASDLLHSSAENNYKRAQLTLADCYAKGILVEQDEAESGRWKLRAEDNQGVRPAVSPVAENEKANVGDTKEEQPVGHAIPAKAQAKAQQPIAHKPATAPSNVIKAAANAQKAISQKETLEGDFSIDVTLPGEEPETVVAEAEPKARQENVADATPTEATKPNVILGPKQLKAAEQAQAASVHPTTTPVLRILYPEDQSMFHTDQVKVKYQLIAGNAADSTRVVVTVDGQRQPQTRAVRAANTIDVDLPRHDCTVMMYAQNKYGNSEPSTIRLIRESTSFELPKLFVVAIGVGDYQDPKLPKLKLTTKDAQDFARAIATKKGLPYEDVQVKVLCDGEATRADIFEAMEWLKQESSPNDVCVFFYAGHGLRDEKDRFYFIPHGCSSDKLYDCFSASDFRNEAEDINGKFIAFVDACYSGALFGGTRSAATAHFIEQLKRSKNGMLLYASSSSDTKSQEDESWGNGAFTKALVEAINGAAREDHAEGLSTQELEHFLYKEVRKITNYKQTPIFINPNGIEHFNLFNYEK